MGIEITISDGAMLWITHLSAGVGGVVIGVVLAWIFFARAASQAVGRLFGW